MDKEIQDFIDDYAPYIECKGCEKLRALYGMYKDPDNEWKAVDDLCGHCDKRETEED